MNYTAHTRTDTVFTIWPKFQSHFIYQDFYQKIPYETASFNAYLGGCHATLMFVRKKFSDSTIKSRLPSAPQPCVAIFPLMTTKNLLMHSLPCG
jgi:hypothetical protein